MGMARTFQNIRLFGTMTATENVMVAMHPHLRGGLWQTILGTPGQRREEHGARDTAHELIEFCGVRGIRTSSRRTSRTATSAGSRWRARSPCSRSCSCSTSRRPA